MRRSLPILILLVGLLVLWGCGKKSTTNPTPTLTTGQQQAFASEAAAYTQVAAGFAGSAPTMLDGNAPTPPGLFSQPHQGPSILGSPPDTIWHGPGPNPHQTGNGSNWYTAHWDTTSPYAMHDTIYVQFTPDIWGSGNPPVTKVEWEVLFSSDMSGTLTKLDEAIWTKYASNGADTTKTDGDVKISGSTTYSSVTSTFTFDFAWINSTRTGWKTSPRTCSGSFTWSSTQSYVNVNYNLTGSFTLTNGSGTGEAKYNNVTFAKYTFNSDGSGYYTLLSDNWQTQYPFTW
jgi:hypothetical protein